MVASSQSKASVWDKKQNFFYETASEMEIQAIWTNCYPPLSTKIIKKTFQWHKGNKNTQKIKRSKRGKRNRPRWKEEQKSEQLSTQKGLKSHKKHKEHEKGHSIEMHIRILQWGNPMFSRLKKLVSFANEFIQRYRELSVPANLWGNLSFGNEARDRVWWLCKESCNKGCDIRSAMAIHALCWRSSLTA